MTTFGWILILISFVVGRSAVKGRGLTDLPGDLGDLVTAAIQGDYASVQEVLDRTGTNLEADIPETSTGGGKALPGVGSPTGGPSATGEAVLAEMRRLGDGKPYKLGATGPNSYDCSGLVYRAMVNKGAYNGARFTTATWVTTAARIGATKVEQPKVGDVVLWPGHMGVVDGADSFYSALSPQSGIKSLSMSAITKQKGAQPTFWRLSSPATSTGASTSQRAV